MTYSVVWFKRDLRVVDHAALHAAAQRGPVLCLYVIEPSVWTQPDAAHQHYLFLLESLRDLDTDLRRLGGQLHVIASEFVASLARLFVANPFKAVYAHEETGNSITYQRDLQVGQWCKSNNVEFHEFRQFGVVRKLKNRDDWKSHWDKHVRSPLLPIPKMENLQFVPLPWPATLLPSPAKLGLTTDVKRASAKQRQLGGRRLGLDVLQDFLSDRSGQYRGGISSPLSAPTACSRLSPYLAFGCLSLREVVQSTYYAIAELPTGNWQKKGLVAFVSRLYWHCHFIQKLESEPELEYQNVHRSYDGLRESDWNPAHFEALTTARTGWPLVDACVVMLRETGWLNFRMRAMLVSVAAYPLWLHWRPVGEWLARQFLDYEPGIHWSQMQMQSGTTGINTPRVYNPIKQAQDHDPQGHFVRRWLPYMRRVPDAWLFEPWRMPQVMREHLNLTIGVGAEFDIPEPLLDLQTATREAKAKLFGLRAQPEVKAGKAAIVEKHASRAKKPAAKTTSRRKATVNNKAQFTKAQFTKAQFSKAQFSKAQFSKAQSDNPQIALDF
jgi:deoxyribodipyrimidine photo-lyase